MMSTCRVCGKLDAFNLQLQSDPTHATRLLDKLFIVARVRLSLEQTRAICFTCAYKIEETYTWLCNVNQYQEEQRVRLRSNIDARVDIGNRTKQVAETIVKKQLWQENLTFNISCLNDEEEKMPNAQDYVNQNDNNDMHVGLNYNKVMCFKENPLENVDNDSSSPPFSFMPLEKPNVNEKMTIKPKMIERKVFDPIDESLSFNFSQFPETKEKQRFETRDVGHNDRPANIDNTQDDLLTFNFTNLTPPKKEVPFKNPKFGGWNLSRTFKTTEKTTEQIYPYNLRYPKTRNFGQMTKDDISKSKIQENAKTVNKCRLRGHESIDIFASQDSYPSAEVFSAGWQLTPDDDLMQRVRVKIHKADF